MIPVLIGAAAVGLGAALLSDDEPKHQEVTREKHYLNSDEVRQLKRSGRIKTAGDSENVPQAQSSSNSFAKDFKMIEELMSNPKIKNYAIRNELQLIKLRAKKQHDAAAADLVEYYDSKLVWRS